jgi:hypothetical protein
VDATADGIPLVRVGVVRVGVEVGIPLVGIDAEDGEAGAALAPPTGGRSSGTLVIHEGARTSSPPTRGRKRKPRKEDAPAAAASDLAAA